MKKFIFSVAIILCGTANTLAETVIAEYFGTKANNSYVNPCKGETVRLCGRVIKEVNMQLADLSVKETVEDADGNIINRDTKQFRTVAQMINYLYNIPENAVIVEDNNDNNE